MSTIKAASKIEPMLITAELNKTFISETLNDLRMRLSKVVMNARTFSGIQPTGALHLGNYLGAVKRWADQVQNVKSTQERDDNIFCVVDQHAITLPQNPVKLRSNIRTMTASLLACGLDPSKCILFQQSTVPEHSELCWVLSTLCSVPRLGQLTTYKEKAAKLKEIPLGLFIYPVLQAADILLYRAASVPVGEDNIQNLQVAQHLAHKFNRNFCSSKKPLFPKPEAILPDNTAARLRSLRSPDHKMSKSDPDPLSCIYLSDSDDVVVKKIKSSVTDSNRELFFDPVSRPGVSNLITIYSLMTDQTEEQVSSYLQQNSINKVQFKHMVSESLIARLSPIRNEMERLLADQQYLDSVMSQGTNAASIMAKETMCEVRKLIGWR